MKSFVVSFMCVASVLLAGALPARAAYSLVQSPTCPANMSCMALAQNFSSRPVPMSAVLTEFGAIPAVPANCTGNVMGNLTKAEASICERFVESNKGTRREIATALVNLGNAYVWLENGFENGSPRGYQKALKTWDRAIALDDQFVDAHLAKGNMVAISETPAEAVPILEKAAALAPNDWRPHAGLANVFYQTHREPEALAEAEKAAALAPGNPSARYVKGKMLDFIGRFEEAIPDLIEATKGYDPRIKRLPGIMQDRNPWEHLADAYHRTGQHNLAAATITKYVDSLPASMIDLELLADRATYLEAAGRFAEAAEDLRKAAAIGYPDLSNQYQTRRAIVLVKAGRTDEAREEFEALLRRGDLNAVLRIQVFLKNQGYDVVTIDGKYNDGTKSAVAQCLKDERCSEGLGQPI